MADLGADESCGVCFHNISSICKLKGLEITDQFNKWCASFKLQSNCVVCLMDIQEDEVYWHPEGGRICKLCDEDYMDFKTGGNK